MTSDAWVLDTVCNGYSIEFVSPPPYSGTRVTPNSCRHDSPVLAEVAVLLDKGAIERVPKHERGTGFYSSFFLTPKKTGGMRAILNLKPLNAHIRTSHFRMDTLRSVIRGMTQGLWAVSLDLTDAYLHVAMNPHHKKFLRFAVQTGDHFQFRCLCFGISTGPRVFTKVVVEVGAWARRLGIVIYQYLDDWILLCPDPALLCQHRDWLLQLLRQLGWLVNQSKSELTPAQRFTYLGAGFDLVEGVVRPSQERQAKLKDSVSALLSVDRCPAVEILSALGMMASCIDLVPLAQLHMRPIQLHLMHFWKASSRDLQRSVPVTAHLKPHLHWWLNDLNLNAGRTLQPPTPQVTMTTDSSTYMWGGHLEELEAQGVWSAEQQRLHINVLELLAVWNCLKKFVHRVRNKVVLVRSDNSTVVSYINRQGGTRSPRLCLWTWMMWQWCIQHQVQLLAVHLAGVNNRLADLLSRHRVQPTEWSLHRGVAQTVFNSLGRQTIDLFASSANAQLPTYCSWRVDPGALATDALAMSWRNLEAYAFPPIALIPRVLRKVIDEGCRLILIAPCWPRRSWFPMLLSLLRDAPLLLPVRPDLLKQQRDRIWHPDPGLFQLVAWPLSGAPAEHVNYLEQLQKCWHIPSEIRLDLSTTIAGKNMLLGVLSGRKILLHHL